MYYYIRHLREHHRQYEQKFFSCTLLFLPQSPVATNLPIPPICADLCTHCTFWRVHMRTRLPNETGKWPIKKKKHTHSHSRNIAEAKTRNAMHSRKSLFNHIHFILACICIMVLLSCVGEPCRSWNSECEQHKMKRYANGFTSLKLHAACCMHAYVWTFIDMLEIFCYWCSSMRQRQRQKCNSVATKINFRHCCCTAIVRATVWEICTVSLFCHRSNTPHRMQCQGDKIVSMYYCRRKFLWMGTLSCSNGTDTNNLCISNATATHWCGRPEHWKSKFHFEK